MFLQLFSIFPSYVNVTVSVINHSRSSRVGFVVTTVLPEHFTTVNVTKYQKDLSVKLMEHNTTVAAFPNSTSIVASSATAGEKDCLLTILRCSNVSETFRSHETYCFISFVIFQTKCQIFWASGKMRSIHLNF